MNKKTNTTAIPKHLRKAFNSLLTAGLLISGSVQAQDSLKTQNLNEVIVSANRMEQNASDVPRSTTVISQTEIQNSTASNVAEILTVQQGIFVIGAGQNPGANQTLFMRGADGGHTIIMIDGVRISDPSSPGNAVDLSEISLSNVERIEVVRGSHSTLYGTSAIGGVINIITKKASANGLKGNIALSAGTFGKSTFEHGQSADLTYQLENGLYFGASAFHRNVNGLDATIDEGVPAGEYNVRDMDGFKKLDLTGKIGFKNENWDVFAYYKSASQNTDIDNGAFWDDDNFTLDFQRDLINWQANYKAENGINFRYSGGHTIMDRIAINDSSIVDFDGNYDRSYMENTYHGTVLNNEFQFSKSVEVGDFVWGVSQYKESMYTKSYYISKSDLWGDNETKSDNSDLGLNTEIYNMFAQADLKGSLLSENLKNAGLVIGTRAFYSDNYGLNQTYAVSPSYKVSKNALIFGNISTGFNIPALYRLYASGDIEPWVTRGNPDLQPETSMSLELGSKLKIAGLNINLSLYQTKVNNIVEYIRLWDKSIAITDLTPWTDERGLTYANLGSQTNQGIELGFHGRFAEVLTIRGNLNLVRGLLKFSPSYTDNINAYHVQIFNGGQFLVEEIKTEGLIRRSSTGNLSFGYQPKENITVEADVRYISGRTDAVWDGELALGGALGTLNMDSYTLFGLAVQYNIMEKINANLRIDNLLNKQYQEINGYTTRGRGFYLKVRYDL